MAVAVKNSIIPQTGKKKKVFSKAGKQREVLQGRIKRHHSYRGNVLKAMAQPALNKANAELKQQAQDNPPGYTDTIALKAIEDAGKKAAATAMEVMGYTLVEEKGWLVKKHADGSTEKISKI